MRPYNEAKRKPLPFGVFVSFGRSEVFQLQRLTNGYIHER